jgi:mycothiol synthase
MADLRPYRDERDWWAIRSLLVESYARSAPGWNWDIRHWDGWRFHSEVPRTDAEMADLIGLCESADGKVVGAVHPEGTGDAWFELDPDRPELFEPLLEWAERHLARPDESGRPRLEVFAYDYDEPRSRVLARRGYNADPDGAWFRRLIVDRESEAAEVVPAPPYALRSTEPSAEDDGRVAELLNLVFGRTIHSAREYQTFRQRSPSFDPELNLVAVAPDGTFAAHVGLTLDDANHHGIVEPVCTHPDHRRRGLAQGLIAEGVRRLAIRGAEIVTLDTGDDPGTNAFYERCGFRDAYHGRWWRRSSSA